MPVRLHTAIIGSVVGQYAAQDFESIPDGVLPAFNYSQQVGRVFLGDALVLNQTALIPSDGEETFDAYPDGVLTLIDRSVSHGNLSLATGFIYPTFAQV